MKKHTPTPIRFFKRHIRLLGFGVMCVMTSFTIGIQSAGDVAPVKQSLAHEDRLETLVETGDIDGDSVLTVEDAIAVLDIVQGYRQPSAIEIERDPNGDFRLTVDDAIRILRTISLR